MTDFETITLDGSRALVRFERRYAASAWELWSALTDRDRMRRWLGAAVSIESRVGGAVRLRWGREHLDALAAMLAGRPLGPHERHRELRPEYASGTGSGSR